MVKIMKELNYVYITKLEISFNATEKSQIEHLKFTKVGREVYNIAAKDEKESRSKVVVFASGRDNIITA